MANVLRIWMLWIRWRLRRWRLLRFYFRSDRSTFHSFDHRWCFFLQLINLQSPSKICRQESTDRVSVLSPFLKGKRVNLFLLKDIFVKLQRLAGSEYISPSTLVRSARGQRASIAFFIADLTFDAGLLCVAAGHCLIRRTHLARRLCFCSCEGPMHTRLGPFIG